AHQPLPSRTTLPTTESENPDSGRIHTFPRAYPGAIMGYREECDGRYRAPASTAIECYPRATNAPHRGRRTGSRVGPPEYPDQGSRTTNHLRADPCPAGLRPPAAYQAGGLP